MKIAIITDWLCFIGGAEKTLAAVLKCYPDADLFAVVDGLSKAQKAELKIKKIHTSFIQKLPFAKSHFYYYLPFMPLAIEQLDLRGYDLVISLSHAVAKGVLTSPDQLHVSYIHSPIRYAWDMQAFYLDKDGAMMGRRLGFFSRQLAKIVLHYLRLWDLRSNAGVDVWLCNSWFVHRRIQKYYGKTAQVINPPVNTHLPTLPDKKEPYYVTTSRLIDYKRIDVIVKAFVANPHQELRIIGEGPMEKSLKSLAAHAPNVKFLGRLPDAAMYETVAKARAFIFAAKEDFGIAPVEAQALGTPVIAYGAGGADVGI